MPLRVRTSKARRHLRALLGHTYTLQKRLVNAAVRDAYNNPEITIQESQRPCLYDEDGRFQMAGFIFGVQRAAVGQPALIVEFDDDIDKGDVITQITTRDGRVILSGDTIVGVVDDVAGNGDLLWRQARVLRHETVV